MAAARTTVQSGTIGPLPGAGDTTTFQTEYVVNAPPKCPNDSPVAPASLAGNRFTFGKKYNLPCADMPQPTSSNLCSLRSHKRIARMQHTPATTDTAMRRGRYGIGFSSSVGGFS